MRAKHFLPEVNMAPKHIGRQVSGINALVGIEYELLVPNKFLEVPGDAPVETIIDIVNFFNSSNGGVYSKINKQFDAFISEVTRRKFGLEELKKYLFSIQWMIVKDQWLDLAEKKQASANQPIENLDKIAWNMFVDSVKDDKLIKDAALIWCSRRNVFAVEEHDWLESIGVKTMSDAQRVFDFLWPSNRLSVEPIEVWRALGKSLSDVLGCPVIPSRGYHGAPRSSTFFNEVGEPNGKRVYIIEPDSSITDITGEDTGVRYEFIGVEIISPPLPIPTILEDLKLIKQWAAAVGGQTNHSTGLHINVSLPEDNKGILDYMKLVLFSGDDQIQRQFKRESNEYCFSSFKQLKSGARNLSNSEVGEIFDLLQHGLLFAAKNIVLRKTNRGVNQHYASLSNRDDKYIEFRSPGGDWLRIPDNILENTINQYAYAMIIAHDPDMAKKEYAKKMFKLIQNQIDLKKTTRVPVELFALYGSGMLDKTQLKYRLSKWHQEQKAANQTQRTLP
jgi:hypothetical protein